MYIKYPILYTDVLCFRLCPNEENRLIFVYMNFGLFDGDISETFKEVPITNNPFIMFNLLYTLSDNVQSSISFSK